MKFKIINVPKKLKGGFIGMNKFAFQSIYHKKYPYSEREILIYSKLPKKVREHTIRHEKIEAYLSKHKHYSYKKAHKEALDLEAD